MKIRSVWLAVVLALISLGCSGEVSLSFGGESVDDAAVELIEGQEMRDFLNIGALTNGACDDPGTDEVGTHFACTADSPDGPLEFDVEIDREDHIFATPLNVISLDQQQFFMELGGNALGEQIGQEFPIDLLDCGDKALVYAAGTNAAVMDCSFGDVGEIYDATITISDVEQGLLSMVIADTPRS